MRRAGKGKYRSLSKTNSIPILSIGSKCTFSNISLMLLTFTSYKNVTKSGQTRINGSSSELTKILETDG